MNINRKQLIGHILLEKQLLTQGQLDDALNLQKTAGGFLCTLLIKKGLVDSRKVFQALSEQLGVPYLDLKEAEVEQRAVDMVPVRIALHYNLIPIKFSSNKLIIALADPLDISKLDDLRLLLDCSIEPVLAYEPDIIEKIKQHYGVGADILDELLGESRGDGSDLLSDSIALDDLESAVEDASIIKFVNELLVQAVDERATDIHMEPYENELRVRFRIDGFLYEIPISESIRLFHNAIVSRVKIMADLDIAEHRVPQDGRIKLKIKGQEIEFRISILPSAFGESVQVRILGASSFISLKQLGLNDKDCQKLESLISKPHGIIFITGPTGSGKSTTLYAALNEKNNTDIKIITTEDPIENQMRGITQIQINPKAGLTFAESLRSILRHDPDIIMVGEVRDAETAEITIRSAMTGHLVLSSVHTNDAASAPTRLIDMGIEPFLVASSLEGLVAQRLVRRVCKHCKEEVSVSASVFVDAGIVVDKESVKVFEGKGCRECRNTGYQGRTAIFEILVVDDDIRELIGKCETAQLIKEVAVKNGMITLRQDGLSKVLAGETTLSEVLRVT